MGKSLLQSLESVFNLQETPLDVFRNEIPKQTKHTGN